MASNTTRTIHKVRVKNPNNKTMYVDVVVVDAISVRGPNGDETVYKTKAEDAVPFIKDTTGDVDTGNVQPSHPTRKSVIQRFTNPQDSSQFIDAEILTAVAYKGPNGQETLLHMPTSGIDAYVVDTTDNGLGTRPSKSSTRKLNVVEIDEITGNPNAGSVNSQQPGYPVLPGGGTQTARKLLIEQTWAVATKGPNGKEILLLTPLHEGSWGTNIEDTTTYVPDPDNNFALGPPDNPDPNPYVVWPATGGPSNKGPNGAWLGVKTPLSQGPLWYIESVSTPFNPILPQGFPFTVTVNLWWGQPPTAGWDGNGPTPGGATYQFALATYKNGDIGPTLGPADANGNQNIIIGNPLQIVYGPSFADATQTLTDGDVTSINSWTAPGSCSLTVTGREGDDSSPRGNTPVFLIQFATIGPDGANGFYGWSDYTATAHDIPPGTEVSWIGALPGQMAPPTITLSSPTPTTIGDITASNPPAGFPLPPGAFVSNGNASAGSVDVDFLSTAPSQRSNQSI